MAHKLAQKSQQVAIRILQYQAVITVIVAMLFLLKNHIAAVSALAGGLISLLPNSLFVLITHQHGGAQSAKKIVSSFYRAEVLKIFLTAMLFAAAFIFFELEILPLLVSYISCHAAFFVAGLSTNKTK